MTDRGGTRGQAAAPRGGLLQTSLTDMYELLVHAALGYWCMRP
jgi:hypothetical protein